MSEREGGALGVSGSLKDVSVSDVMQFIHLGKRTGTLRLARGRELATIGFVDGKIVNAEAPGTPRLGDLLVNRGLIDRMHLDAALLVQRRSPTRRSLGQILASSGRISADALRAAVEEQVKLAVSEVLTWDSGEFEFALGAKPTGGEAMIAPADVVPDAEVNTQAVLLEASRIFDERNRRTGDQTEAARRAVAEATAPADASFVLTAKELQEALQGLEPGGPKPAAEMLELQIVSSDQSIAPRLATSLRNEIASVRAVPPEHAGEGVLGAPAPIVLVDLRRGRIAPGVVAAIHRNHPRASLIAMVEPGGPFVQAYEFGALATVPPALEAVAACVANVISNRRDLVRGRRGGESAADLDRLRRVFGDLRSGMVSATMALNLMHVISESVERAALLLVKRDHLATIGAFGHDSQGRLLALSTRGLRVSLAGESAITRAVRTAQAESATFDDAALPEPLRSLLGRPKSGQVAVFPLSGAQGVIAVVYADNGTRDEAIQDLELLELATNQAGVALENEFLRRQISSRHE